MAGVKLRFAISVYFWSLALTTSTKNFKQFTYNGFQQAELHLDGGATVHTNGLLQLTNTSNQVKAHAFVPHRLNFDSRSSLSFSTTFAFAMFPEIQATCGQGIAFVLSPSMDFSQATAGQFFGLFNSSTNGKSSNRVFAVELDSMQSIEFEDIDNNHVGIDVNDLRSMASATAGYFNDAEKRNKSLNLNSAKPMQIWIDYDSVDTVVKVTLAPLGLPRPSKPLLSLLVNLSEVVRDTMYVGFSSSTSASASSHYVLGWSFSQGKQAQAQSLDLSKLPSLPHFGSKNRKLSRVSMVFVILTAVVLTSIALGMYLRWRKKFEEILEDWEQQYILQRYSYKDLYKATKGFKDKELLGMGGFGKVYKGKLPYTNGEIAVKKVSHSSGQGVREFVTEIACMGRLRHRNLVQLRGYCRRKGDLFLVYDYMVNGSLDKYLYEEGKPNLSWSERFKIVKGLASALVYLHEEWEQVVVHRDVKPSNVLLDASMNARLGDFGVARLYDHGSNPHKTHIVGTCGYLAPELIRKGRATTATDVFSFGIIVLEVACGRSPLSFVGGQDYSVTDWVNDCWIRGVIVEASDPRLGGNYVLEEMKLVLKLGMLCSQPSPEARPKMRQVMQFLDGDATLPVTFPSDGNNTLPSFSPSSEAMFTSYSIDSVLIVGR
ncbi:L-type lectin-domain containing receptor kinase SIT2-like [Silene latifolia]|uniref:L-type lectin-domain containing receptor kinase SIT2-like n=1 Tax=Silene latifolia TaxID=37657 RepID=UPI003D76CA03